MKPRVSIETTIPSYLTAWPSQDLIQAAHQQVTRDWWSRRDDFELFVSQLVIDECEAGDPEAAAARLAALANIPLLEPGKVADRLVRALVREVPLSQRALDDAAHFAIAAVHQLDYFLTWNCRHIANATLRPRIEAVCLGLGHRSPIICKPMELLVRE